MYAAAEPIARPHDDGTTDRRRSGNQQEGMEVPGLPQQQVRAEGSDAACALLLELDDELAELTDLNGGTNLFHDLQVVMQIVNRIESRAKNFAGTVQMVQVSA